MKKILIFFFLSSFCFAQNNEKYDALNFSPELFFGQTFQPNSWFPKLKSHYMLGFSFEKNNNIFKNKWSNTINLSSTGVGLYFSSLGNQEVVGNAISILPFVEINLNKKESFSTKFGLGTSYFTTQYHPENNPLNTAVSTKLTWAFQTFVYYKFHLKNKRTLKIGAGYFHHSNGHTQLPNSGLNTALASVSTSFKLNKKQFKENHNLTTDFKKYKAFYAFRYGQGIQKFIDHESTVKAINAIEFKGGFFYKDILKFSAGITYNFYRHYYDYIKENEVDPYFERPILNASNIYLSIGVEALFGNIGIDWEGGLNVYKPFYKEHYILQDETLNNIYKLKKLFLGRLGLKLYVINTLKKPKNNFYIGAHIKSNLSQADFTELSIGFVHRIFK
ncbi:lipid A 3-O-deacylase PagL [Lutibacter oceani]|uniref:Lipid A 3-O-deacylase PagL n=1 Tax=Lutibacter oceani TaxID=1853311 RepID=A0A3D9RP91_9FLAO|nr:acyloxyacyl hydrolase [Lutibacter oceani]REE81743.1 lipid A 3-O-deacylase PagL [Lutibacter oceani]